MPSDEKSTSIALAESHRRYLISQIKRFVPDAVVWAFGSRVKGTHRSASDLDLAVKCDKQTALRELPRLKFELAESDLPFTVQLLDFNRLPRHMQDTIRKEAVPFYGSGTCPDSTECRNCGDD